MVKFPGLAAFAGPVLIGRPRFCLHSSEAGAETAASYGKKQELWPKVPRNMPKTWLATELAPPRHEKIRGTVHLRQLPRIMP